MNTITDTTKALLNALAEQGYDPSYSEKAFAVHWINSYKRKNERTESPLTKENELLMIHLFGDVLRAVQILGVNIKDVSKALEKLGLREHPFPPSWRKSHE